MKIVYCIAGLRHTGGMERLLTNKVNWLVAHGVEVSIVTTDQGGENPFFPLPPKVRRYDLDINYEENNGKGFLNKVMHYPLKQLKHKQKLTKLLGKLQADIVISMFCNDVSFLWKIRDGSKKLLEVHFSRYKRLQYGRKGIWKIADRFRSWTDVRTASHYDRFVVCTHEDKGYWGNMSNIRVIYNAKSYEPAEQAGLNNKRVIAVGRLDYQKGFDDLIRAWTIVQRSRPDWQLDIFGNGALRESLQHQIDDCGLQGSVHLRPSVSRIDREYLNSSFLAMSSRYEGLPLALIEAQAFGLPIVSYACKCGPKDIVTEGEDGFLVPVGDVEALAEKMIRLMEDESLRHRMGEAARINSQRFSEDVIMRQWMDLFNEVVMTQTDPSKEQTGYNLQD
jgi:glycosyltransferase involved in cell wall biosynthesis